MSLTYPSFAEKAGTAITVVEDEPPHAVAIFRSFELSGSVDQCRGGFDLASVSKLQPLSHWSISSCPMVEPLNCLCSP